MSRPQRGLTMIEVLAAMVIFSAGAVVLFGWIGQTADRLGRLSREQAQLFGELRAIEYLRTLNPMRDPAGEERIGDARFRWRATPIGGEQPSRTPAGEEGNYVLQLYRVSLWVDGGQPSERALWLTGWRQVRTVQNNPFGALGGRPDAATGDGRTPPPAVPPTPPGR